MFILVLPLVFSSNHKSFPENQVGNIQEVQKGEDAKVLLPMFSKTWLRIYEGSKIDFNIVDPDNSRIVLIKNSLIVKKIGEKETVLLLSKDSGEDEEVIIKPSENYKVNYTYEAIPYMILRQESMNLEGKNSVIFFEVPFLKTSKFDIPKTFVAIDPTEVSTGSKKEKYNPFTVSLVGIIIILVGVLAFIKFRK